MVTPILTYPTWKPSRAAAAAAQGRSQERPSRGCGVHIHIGAKGHTPQTLRNLANIMASHESFFWRMPFNIDRGRIADYCANVSPGSFGDQRAQARHHERPGGHLVQRQLNATYGRNQHYNDSRYHMLNLHATFTKGTVEFRLFQFDAPPPSARTASIAGQLRATSSSASHSANGEVGQDRQPQAPANDNPSYAMRTCSPPLGFIGEEFATAATC